MLNSVFCGLGFQTPGYWLISTPVSNQLNSQYKNPDSLSQPLILSTYIYIHTYSYSLYLVSASATHPPLPLACPWPSSASLSPSFVLINSPLSSSNSVCVRFWVQVKTLLVKITLTCNLQKHCILIYYQSLSVRLKSVLVVSFISLHQEKSMEILSWKTMTT